MAASRKRVQRSVDRAHPGQPEHADGDRDHADVDADQRHQAVEAEVGGRALGRGGDLVRHGRAGRGHQHQLVPLPLDPRVADVDLPALQPAQLVARLRERAEGVVDHHLRHPHRVGPVVAHVQLDLAGSQHRALHRQLLDRHAVALEAGRVEGDEQPDRRAEDQQRHEAQQPGTALAHQATTSKKPIQPSSANSDTWAWNMYLPSYGKRSSRIPRSPWPWITVSVKSRGSSRVPVG